MIMIRLAVTITLTMTLMMRGKKDDARVKTSKSRSKIIDNDANDVMVKQQYIWPSRL